MEVHVWKAFGLGLTFLIIGDLYYVILNFCVAFLKGMLALELSSYGLEIANDSCTTLTQNLISYQHSSRVLQADWLILGNNEKANYVRTCY